MARLGQGLRPAKITGPLDAFAFLLSAGLLVHTHAQTTETNFPYTGSLLFTVAAVVVLFRPGSRVALVGMGVGFIIETWDALPDVTNHAFALAFGMGAVALIAGASKATQAPLTSAVYGVARLLVVSILGLAAFQKMNRGFVDGQVSCAGEHLRNLADNLRLPLFIEPGWQTVASGWMVIGVELSIPLLLIARRTRPVGLLLAYGFHLANGLNGHHAFSASAFALYFAFFPAAAWRAFSDPLGSKAITTVRVVA